MTVTPLHNALERFGRTANRLGPDTILAADYLLEALAGPGAIANSTDRVELARWTYDQLEQIIASRTEDTERRLAQTILAACREFHGVQVKDRRSYLRTHGERHIESAFKRQRRTVLARIAADLEQAYHNKCAPQIFLAGRYLDEPRQHHFARLLGTALASLPITLVCGGSRVGAHVSHAMARQLQADGSYASGRTIMYVRTDSTRLSALYQPLGLIIHVHADRTVTRRIMLRTAQVCIVLGGADFGDADGNGTAQEVAMARDFSIPLIPIPRFGGTADHIWQQLRPTLCGTPIEEAFNSLASPDPHVQIQAVIQLVRHYLDMPAQ